MPAPVVAQAQVILTPKAERMLLRVSFKCAWQITDRPVLSGGQLPVVDLLIFSLQVLPGNLVFWLAYPKSAGLSQKGVDLTALYMLKCIKST